MGRTMLDFGGSTFAFFGRHDHYLKWRVVNIGKYEKMFGKTYTVYDGTHFMEEEYVLDLLLPKVLEILKNY